MVREGIGYLNHGFGGISVVDLSDPLTPREIGAFEGAALDGGSLALVQVGDRLVALGLAEDFGPHLLVVDVDPGSPTAFEELASYERRPQVSARAIIAFGDRALVAYGQDGLRVLDLGDAANPDEIGHFSSWLGTGDAYGRAFFEGAISAAHDAERDLVLVGDRQRGLLVLALEPTTALRPAGWSAARQSASLDRALH